MKNPGLERLQARIRTLLIFYAPCAAATTVLCLLIYFVSNYYATAYPYSGIGALPHNLTTFSLSVFNGYTEKVPFNANQTAIIQSIGSIRQDADAAVTTTIEELVLALVSLLLFSLLSVILNQRAGIKDGQDSKPYFLPALFLFALVSSQYITFGVDLMHGSTPSGISLFFVDSLLTIIWFGLGIEWLLWRFKKTAGQLAHPDNPALLSRSMTSIKILMIFWPIVLIFITLLLTLNVGLFEFNRGFLPTYFAHFSGLLEFAIMFALLFYYQELLSFIRKIHG